MPKLKVQLRELMKRKTNKLRNENIIPGVVYGRGFKSKSIQVDYKELDKIYKQAGESTLIDLEIGDSKPMKVLIHDIQYHPLTNEIQHIDFFKIKSGEKITVDVELKFVGISPAVKNLGGNISYNIDKIQTECLPEDLLNEIEVDVSSLQTFEDVIRISDLNIPDKVKILQKPEELVVKVEEIKEVIEEKPEEEEEKLEDVEVISEKQKPEEDKPEKQK